jgi:hypothetical protein
MSVSLSKLPAIKYAHVTGFQCGAQYVEFCAEAESGWGAYADGSFGKVEYCRDEAERYVKHGIWKVYVEPVQLAYCEETKFGVSGGTPLREPVEPMYERMTINVTGAHLAYEPMLADVLARCARYHANAVAIHIQVAAQQRDGSTMYGMAIDYGSGRTMFYIGALRRTLDGETEYHS